MVESIVAHNSAESASDGYDKSGQITSADYASLSDDYDNTGNRDLTYAICKARWSRVLQDEQDEFILCILSLMLLHALLLILAIIKQSERRSIDRGTKRALTNLKQYDTKDHETRRAQSAPSFLQRRVFLAPKAGLTKVK